MDDEEDTDARSSTDTPGDSRSSQQVPVSVPENHKGYVVYVPPKFFENTGIKVGKKKDSTLYRCLMGCKAKFDKHGKEKLLSVQDKSVYNCRRHIKSHHLARMNDFNTAFAKGKGGEVKEASTSSSKPANSQQLLPFFLQKQGQSSQIRTQEELDDKILNYIVQSILPIREVEKEGFRELIASLIGELVIKGRTFFTEKLEREHSQVHTNLIMALELAKWISTTADLWTAHGRSFLGMTVHWIGEDLIRRSALLALRRIVGSHTHDVIAKAMWEVHREFNIVNKVNVSITDNGSNFVKSFQVFGPNQPKETDDSDDEEEDCVYVCIDDIFNVQVEANAIIQEAQDASSPSAATVANHASSPSATTVAQPRSRSRAPNLDSDSDSSEESDYESDAEADEPVTLPRHFRCSCHTLNLIATADVNKITNTSFNKKRDRLNKKLRSVWGKQGGSSKSSDFIRSKLGKVFVVPNKTRWNSLYDAYVRIQFFIKTKVKELEEVFKEFKVRPLTEVEKTFVSEYIFIMEPFTQSLDLLQNEEKLSIGSLLPTITSLKKDYEEFSFNETVVHCQPIVIAVLDGIEKRFDGMFNDKHIRLASLSDPNYKTIWVEDEKQIAEDIQLLKEAVKQKKIAAERLELESIENLDDGSADLESPPKKRRLLDRFKKNSKRVSKELDEVDRFLSEPTGDVTDLERFPLIKQIYIEENSSLPSSAACERIFSVAGLIFVPKRTNLSDANFERLLFLKMNRRCLHNWQEHKSTTQKKQ